jgi:hypothetical protein
VVVTSERKTIWGDVAPLVGSDIRFERHPLVAQLAELSATRRPVEPRQFNENFFVISESFQFHEPGRDGAVPSNPGAT